MPSVSDEFCDEAFVTVPGRGGRTSRTGCARARRLFSSFLAGEMSAPRLADALGAHFGDCPTCRAPMRPTGE